MRACAARKLWLSSFGTVYPGDVLLNAALRRYKPTTWSLQDTVIDIGEKLIQAEATGAIFDRYLDSAPASRA